jgi:hypothetical protein
LSGIRDINEASTIKLTNIGQTQRKIIMKTLLTLLALASFTLLEATAAPVAPQIEVDWPAFLGQHDLVWEQVPRQWNEGAFVGNGQLGMMVYATLKVLTEAH